MAIVNWETDLDKPGPQLSRPGFDRILARIEAGATGGIAVAKIDRLSRASVVDALKLVEEVIDHGGTLAAMDLGIDPTTPFGEFALTLLLGLARMESRRIGEMWLDARTRAVERGVHISGQPPTGYLRQDDGRLRVDPEIAPYVSEAFERRASGESWKAIADWLTEKSVPTLRGAPCWTIATVRSMIRNRVYLGEARSGDLVKLGAHKALTDPESFEAATRRRAPQHAPTGNAAGLLSGIIRCAGCSYALKPSMGKTRHGKRRREYRCRPDKAVGRCPAPASVSAEAVEREVVRRFLADYDDSYVQFEQATQARRGVEGDIARSRADFEAALDERLADALGGPDSEHYLSVLRARREGLEADESRLAAVIDEADSELPHPRRLREDWPNRSLQERRVLIASVYESIFLRRASSPREPPGSRLRFFAAGASPPLPIRGQRGEIRSVDLD